MSIKAYVPGVFVPNAVSLNYKDSKGRSMWDMPAPIKLVQHTTKTKRGTSHKQVPIYRGMDSITARRLRAAWRKAKRILEAKSAEMSQ